MYLNNPVQPPNHCITQESLPFGNLQRNRNWKTLKRHSFFGSCLWVHCWSFVDAVWHLLDVSCRWTSFKQLAGPIIYRCAVGHKGSVGVYDSYLYNCTVSVSVCNKRIFLRVVVPGFSTCTPSFFYLFVRFFLILFGDRFGRVSRGTLPILATTHAVLIKLHREYTSCINVLHTVSSKASLLFFDWVLILT